MPELPEVETNASNLRRWAEGRRVVEVLPPSGARELGGLSPSAFADILRGRVIEDITRRGKWIVVRLSGGAGLGLHLGMTGKLAHSSANEEDPRFTRAAFSLDDKSRVLFVDMRRFGRLRAVPRYEDLLASEEISTLGPDALTVTPEILKSAFLRTKRTVKETIMDQRVLAGVGNLYAAEALFRAGIHPATPASEVAKKPEALQKLSDGIREALRQGLQEMQDQELPEYIEEGAPNPFYVYDRVGEPCLRCGTTIEAITLGGRTSAFCPHCQPAPAKKRAPKSKPRKKTAK